MTLPDESHPSSNHDPARLSPETTYVFWLSRHQWSLIQRGEAPAQLQQPYRPGASLVTTLTVDDKGQPIVQESWIERRSFFGQLKRTPLPARSRVVVSFADG